MNTYRSNPSGIGVIRSDGVCIPADPENPDWCAYQDWLAEGGRLAPPTVDEVVQRFLPRLQEWLDGVARQKRYDSALSCISYEGCGEEEWEHDAAVMKAYRTRLWRWGYAQQTTLNTMSPSELAALTVEDVIAQAPKAEDSGWIVPEAGANPTA